MTTNSGINSFSNASLGKDINILNDIHRSHINIAIYQRTIKETEEGLSQCLEQDIDLKLNGQPAYLIQAFRDYLISQQLPDGFLLNDFSNLLKVFQKISRAVSFQVFFSTIKTDMCRRFHTDSNNLRLLCTYRGPGTLWLPEAAVDRSAYGLGKSNNQIVRETKLIQQAQNADVLILKGALYPYGGNAILHRSPNIEKTKEKRLLLRIDMNL